MRQEFQAEIQARGPAGGWKYITVPFDVLAAFGTKARVAVRGTINGFPYRSSLMPAGDGTFYMAINKEMQKSASADTGDTVDVVMERDDTPRQLALPADLTQALQRNPEAQGVFDGMSYSHRKEYVDWITEAKREETRRNRIDKAMGMIAGKKRLKG